MWQMKFNIDKCFILRVGRPKHKLVHLYTLHNQNLSETDSAKYLGLTITSDLQWNQHINNITNTATSILGLLRRNLRIPSQTIKTHAYQSLVRPHLEYASTVWDPHTQKHIHLLIFPLGGYESRWKIEFGFEYFTGNHERRHLEEGISISFACTVYMY